MAYKKKVAIAKQPFTLKGEHYKLGSVFKGKRSLVKALINKNLIKWQ